jgi:DNA-directed RNA polymerase beta' subunit
MEQIVEEPIHSNLYCIKCRAHTDNIDIKQETITSKNKPRSVLKATCAVCTKKKNRFVKTVTPIEDLIVSKKTEMLPKKIKVVKNSTKKLEKLLQEFIIGITPKNDQ